MRSLLQWMAVLLTALLVAEAVETQAVLKNIARNRRLTQWPYGLRTVGPVAYFSARTRNRWSFWRTDGTEAGTVELQRDLQQNLSRDFQLFDAQWSDRYFFSGNGRLQITWRTSSTVREARPSVGGTLAAREMVVVGNNLYFSGSNNTNGFELWSMPTTSVTARLVKDIRPGTASGLSNTDRNWMVAYGTRRFFFVADDGVHGRELWMSDGTAAGTRMVFDLAPGSASSNPRDLAPAGNGRLYFTAAPSGGSGRELWVSDINGATPVRVSPLTFSFVDSMTNYSGGVLFRANANGGGAELWRSNGTAAGTQMIVDFAPGSRSGVSRIVGGSQYIYFAGNPGSGTPVLCRTDGTAAGTIALGGQLPEAFGVLNTGSYSGAIFMARDGTNGTEPWITDGTPAGTRLLTDLNPGTANAFERPSSQRFPGSAIQLGTKTVFFAQNDETLANLFITDGTANGTQLLADVLQFSDGDSFPNPLGALGNGEFAFSASNGINGNELWISDGTDANTRMIELTPGFSGTSMTPLGTAGGRVVFARSTSAEGLEPWVTDGTPQGTRLLMDIRPGTISSAPVPVANLNGNLLFGAARGTARTLWITDGTSAGTREISDVQPSSGQPQFGFATPFQGRVLFRGRDPRIGEELYVTDGTTAGTQLVADLNPFASSSNVSYLAATPTKVYFRASGRVTPNTVRSRLWRTDGTPEGTLILYDESPDSITTMGEVAIFAANFGSVGRELLRSDGTPNGTTLIKDVFPGSSSSQPGALASLGTRVVFHAVGNGVGREPWTTDGTEAGTRLLGDLWPGSGSSNPSDFFVVGSRAFFSARIAGGNPHLFVTDGVTVTRIDGAAAPTGFHRFGDRVFFSALHSTMGREPWTINATDFGAGFCEGYGMACGGSLGSPSLTAIGVPAPLGGFGLDLGRGYPHAPAAMLLGRQRAAIPFGSCTLLTAPLYSAPLLTNGVGRARLDLPIRSGFGGQNLFAQSIVANPRTRSLDSLALTRGLRIHLGR